MPPDLVLANARVLTMDEARPRVQALAVVGERIAWVGSADEAIALAGAGARVIDCGGAAVLPGFHDAHVHLLAYAASLASADCRPPGVSSIQDVQSVLRTWANRTPEGEWIRGWGYDETALTERRHPTRHDLDEASPRHPARLDHRSGHAAVLNSLALERVGIRASTPEPRGATIARDLESGEPNGILFEMDEYLGENIPPLDGEDLAAAFHLAARKLLAFGITSVQDATHHNGVDRWRLLDGLRKSSAPTPRITVMAGSSRLSEFVEAGLRFGDGDDWLRLGHAKLMATASSGSQSPSPPELGRVAADCVRRGFPVAIHAVEAEVVASAAQAIAGAPMPPISGASHRIEHCSECPPHVLEALERSGATVATQPGFVYHSGDRYLKTVPPHVLPHLYRMRSLAKRGVRLVFGSDAPISPPDPMRALYSAVTRNTESGEALGVAEALDLPSAISAYTIAPAASTGVANALGALTPGRLADAVLFDRDLLELGAERIREAQPAMTIMGGRVVWEA